MDSLRPNGWKNRLTFGGDERVLSFAGRAGRVFDMLVRYTDYKGIAVGTSKSQLHKARMRLRELIKQEFQPQEQNYLEAQ